MIDTRPIDLLRQATRKGIPPDALMVPKWGPANENLYRWWHEEWAPVLIEIRKYLDEFDARMRSDYGEPI